MTSLSIYLFNNVSICLPTICTYLPTYLSVYLSIYLSIYLYICISIVFTGPLSDDFYDAAGIDVLVPSYPSMIDQDNYLYDSDDSFASAPESFLRLVGFLFTNLFICLFIIISLFTNPFVY